jgi:hypothetical protein
MPWHAQGLGEPMVTALWSLPGFLHVEGLIG